MSTVSAERLRARKFGFWSLVAWTGLGLALESAHAFKLSAYLDQPQRRELLVWAHAHGVGLALLVLAYAAVGIEESSLRHGKLLRAAALLMPLGFALAVLGQGETDPGPTIWLVPVGALLLLYALIGTARGLK